MPNQLVVACVDRAGAKSAFAGADAAIITPSPAVRSYLKLFQCVAVVVFDDGRVSVSLDPSHPSMRRSRPSGG